jgi:hypothetical protein
MMRKMDAEGALAVAESHVSAGMSEGFAAKAAGISAATFKRWRQRAEAGKPLKDYSGSGRPPSCEVCEADAAVLRSYVIRANVGRRRVSAAGGCRLAAMDPDSGLSEALRGAILKPRADPSALPRPVLQAVREVSAPAVVGRYRDARDGLNNGLYAPGYLRCPEDAIHRRFRPLERTVWDDGSTNFLFWVPWERGGDRCSDRFGVRLVRGQMLACIDSGSGHCVHYSFVVRERDSYTAGDVCAALGAAWAAHGVPAGTVMEGGSWQAARTMELCRRGGSDVVSAKGRPIQKLVERFFGNVWTAHAGLCPDGHIGRFRGETWKESKDSQACRDGRLDPRKAFPCMTAFLGGLDRSVDIANRTEINSKTYGRWTPCERFAAEEPASHRLPTGLERLTLPVIEQRTVKRGGMVTVRAANAAGVDWEFAFAVADGHKWDGARVSVAFDPRFPERGADVRLSGKQAHGPDFLLVDAEAASMGPAPVLDAAGPAWSLRWFDSREQAREAKARARAAVLTVARSADSRGRMTPARTEDGDRRPEDGGRRPEVEKAAELAWPEPKAEAGELMDLFA